MQALSIAAAGMTTAQNRFDNSARRTATSYRWRNRARGSFRLGEAVGSVMGRKSSESPGAEVTAR